MSVFQDIFAKAERAVGKATSIVSATKADLSGAIARQAAVIRKQTTDALDDAERVVGAPKPTPKEPTGPELVRELAGPTPALSPGFLVFFAVVLLLLMMKTEIRP